MSDVTRLSPSDRFNSLVEGLFSDVQSRLNDGWFPDAGTEERSTIIQIWRRLRRMQRRFAEIMAQLKAGTLAQVGAQAGAQVGPEVAARPAAESAADRPAGSAPRWRPLQPPGWVIHAISWFVWNRHCDYKEMLADPEMEAQVVAAPQLGSVLRPMCQMLHVKQPAWLRRVRKARKRVKKEIPPAPEWITSQPGAIFKPDGSVWMRFGGSSVYGKGPYRSLEEAQRWDQPQRIWPRED